MRSETTARSSKFSRLELLVPGMGYAADRGEDHLAVSLFENLPPSAAVVGTVVGCVLELVGEKGTASLLGVLRCDIAVVLVVHDRGRRHLLNLRAEQFHQRALLHRSVVRHDDLCFVAA